MMHRLMHRLNIIGCQARRHWFDAFALNRQQKTLAVRLQRFVTIEMPCGLRQALDVCRKAVFLSAWRDGFGAHVQLSHQTSSAATHFYDTVVLVASDRVPIESCII